jgi:predicted N-acetyltransferase YhbS
VIIRKLAVADDRGAFSSGSAELDEFLKTRALAHQSTGSSATYVVASGTEIHGYATITMTTLSRDLLARREQRNRPAELSALLLGRLATAETHHGKGIAKALLRYTMNLALDLEEQVGCVGVVVDAKAGMDTFYEKFGFSLFPTGTENMKMLLPCTTIRKAAGR